MTSPARWLNFNSGASCDEDSTAIAQFKRGSDVQSGTFSRKISDKIRCFLKMSFNGSPSCEPPKMYDKTYLKIHECHYSRLALLGVDFGILSSNKSDNNISL